MPEYDDVSYDTPIESPTEEDYELAPERQAESDRQQDLENAPIESPTEEDYELAPERQAESDRQQDLGQDVSNAPIEQKDYIPLEDALAEASPAERDVYDKAGLTKGEVNGRDCLMRNDVDPYAIDEDGVSNLEKMIGGKPPSLDGAPVELHHIGQNMDAPLAELTFPEHRGIGNDAVLHDKKLPSEIDRNAFNKEKKDYWAARAKGFIGG